MIEIDGSKGEGGGQVLRTALGLAARTGRPTRIKKIRAGRARPGLMRQHLTAARAAAAISGGELEGDRLGSTALTFRPGAVTPGEYEFKIGSAGSVGLVFQTVLPALMTAPGPSTVVIEGGTHNQWAPPYDFLAESFLPQLARFGPRVTARLERPGFYPAGGGRVVFEIEPAARLTPVDYLARGEVRSTQAVVVLANLPERVAKRERQELRRITGWPPSALEVRRPNHAAGPGNAVFVKLAFDELTVVYTGFGAKGRPADEVAREPAGAALAFMASDAVVDERLADQLVIPMALAGGGRLRTYRLSGHLKTQLELVGRWLDVPVAHREDGGVVEVGIGGGARCEFDHVL